MISVWMPQWLIGGAKTSTCQQTWLNNEIVCVCYLMPDSLYDGTMTLFSMEMVYWYERRRNQKVGSRLCVCVHQLDPTFYFVNDLLQILFVWREDIGIHCSNCSLINTASLQSCGYCERGKLFAFSFSSKVCRIQRYAWHSCNKIQHKLQDIKTKRNKRNFVILHYSKFLGVKNTIYRIQNYLLHTILLLCKQINTQKNKELIKN